MTHDADERGEDEDDENPLEIGFVESEGSTSGVMIFIVTCKT